MSQSRELLVAPPSILRPRIARATSLLVALATAGFIAVGIRPARSDDNGVWSRLPPIPSPYQVHAIDPGRRQLIVIGNPTGFDPGVWSVSIDTYELTELHPSGERPTGWLTGFYDSEADRILIIDMLSRRVWTLTLSPALEFSAVDVSAQPTPSLGSWPTFDTLRRRILWFGSLDQSRRNEVWALTISGNVGTWSQVITTGSAPAPRMSSLVAYDSRRDRMIVHGGSMIGPFDGNSSYQDTWALPLNTNAWELLTVKDTDECLKDPGGLRPAGTGLYVASADLILRLRDTCTGYALSTFAAGDTMWTPFIPFGEPPGTPVFGAVEDTARHRIIFQSVGAHPQRTGLWALEFGSTRRWEQLSETRFAPEARAGHAGAYEAELNSMVVTMGNSFDVLVNDTWQFSLGETLSWRRVMPASPPVAREGSALVSNFPLDDLLMFGGSDGTHLLDDFLALRLGGRPQWRPHGPPSPVPPARVGAALVTLASRNQQLLFGGRRAADTQDDRDYFNDTWMFDRAWSEFTARGSLPVGRSGHGAIYDASRGRVILFGGDSSWTDGTGLHRAVYGDVWAFSLEFGTWSLLTDTGPRRTGASVVYDAVRDRIVVFGGFTETNARSNEVWAYSLAQNTWTRLTPTGLSPDPRALHVAIYDPQLDRMIVFGGHSGGEPSAETWMLDWGATAEPELQCEWIGTVEPGGTASFRGVVTSRMGAPQDFAPTVEFSRPGLSPVVWPRRLEPNRPDTVSWVFSLPDSLEGSFATRFHARSPGVPMPLDVCHSILTIPVLIRSTTATVEPGVVRLRWAVGDLPITLATVYRQTPGEAWERRAEISPSGDALDYVDTSVLDGVHYAYRLGIMSAGHELFRGLVEVTAVDPTSSSDLDLIVPSPSADPLLITFSLPVQGSASVALFDVSGRLVLEQDLGTLTVGPHRVQVAEARSLDSGLYFIRLRQGERSVTRRVCMLR